MTQKKLSILFIYFLAVFAILTAQSSRENTFTINFSELSLGNNPQYTFSTSESQVFGALFESLISFDAKTLVVEPGLAKRWEISDDVKQYTFYLQDDLYYSNGVKLTAHDIKRSWVTMLGAKRRAEYASLLDVIVGVQDYRSSDNEERDASDIGIVALDDSTLQINLTEPAPHFLQIIGLVSFAPTYEFQSSEGEIIGNGAYYVESSSDTEYLLKKNPYYWDAENVSIPYIKILIDNDAEKMTEMFNRGQLDWITSGNVITDQLYSPKSFQLTPLFATTYYYFSNQGDFYSQKNVRQALLGLLPLKEIRSQYFLPSSTLVPPFADYSSIPNYKDGGLELSKKLLRESGYDDANPLPPITILLAGEEPDETTLKMKEAWETNLNVEVNIVMTTWGEYYDKLRTDSYTIAIMSWIGDYPDPMTFLQMWLSDSNLYSQYSDAEYDDLVQKSMVKSPTQRLNALKKAEEYLLESAQVIPLNYTPAYNVIDLDLFEGWYPNVLDHHPLKSIRLKQTYNLPGTL